MQDYSHLFSKKRHVQDVSPKSQIDLIREIVASGRSLRNPFFLDSESGFDWTVNPESTGHPIRF